MPPSPTPPNFLIFFIEIMTFIYIIVPLSGGALTLLLFNQCSPSPPPTLQTKRGRGIRIELNKGIYSYTLKNDNAPLASQLFTTQNY